MKICQNEDCKKEFIPSGKYQKYCSKKCYKFCANKKYGNERFRKYRTKKLTEDRASYREKSNSYQEKYYENLRVKVLEKYGKRCANSNCPIPRDKLDVRALQIDHVNNDGYKERKLSHNQVKYLKKVLADSEGNYQLLCVYCNWLKRDKNKGRKTHFSKFYPLMIKQKTEMDIFRKN